MVLLSQIWIKTGLLTKLLENVKVVRGRMGLYEVLDFVLLLLGYAVSEEKSLKFFFKIVKPFKRALAALFNREQSPRASALSRFLGSVSNEAVKALRKLLLEDLIENGISKENMGGLYDRKANHHIVFDADATKEVVRQISLPKDAQYPEPSRHRGGCEPRYARRKRGEAVRSYTTLQQSHTSEWLGAFGAAGNGKIWEELQEACQLVARYLQGHELSLEFGLLRLDEAYGWARGACIAQQNSLNYLMRCSDYGLLDNVLVTQGLENEKGELFHQVDTGKSRQVIDVGFINWSAGKDPSMSVRTRLIVAISEVASDSKVHTGKRIADKVYELFTTSVAIEQLRVLDMISLYCERGAFEQTLSQQDKELAPQRWCSEHGAGQDFWQLLSQWI